MSPLSHSIMTNFHFPFLYFINAGLLNKIRDIYGNPVIYFAITNENKFAFSYLLHNKKFDVNSKYFNNSQTLADILITNQNNSITKYIVKYYWNEVDLNSIINCRKNILSYNTYNIYNYELLNTLYYFKTRNYLEFISSIFKRNNIDRDKKLLNNNNNQILKENNFGYHYKYINLRMMFYNLILPVISPLYKFLCLFIYFSFLYFITNENNNSQNENPRNHNYKYEIGSYTLLNIITILLFVSKTNIITKKQSDLEEEISKKLKSNLKDLPDIEEICPVCAHIKDIS
jgi:type V secretory pathway adhesin AidA